MLAWTLEVRKHVRLFGAASVVVLGVALARVVTSNTVTEVAWVFGVLLASCAAVFYAASELYRYTARGHDLFLHLSTRAPALKVATKAGVLGAGMFLVFVIAEVAALAGPGPELASGAAYGYAFVAKLVSLASFLLLAAAASAGARRLVRALSTQVVLVSLIVAVVTGLELALVWSWGSIAGQEWSVGVSSDYLGLPVYATILPVTPGEAADGLVHPAMIVSLALNVAVAVVSGAAVALDVRRPRALRTLSVGSAARS